MDESPLAHRPDHESPGTFAQLRRYYIPILLLGVVLGLVTIVFARHSPRWATTSFGDGNLFGTVTDVEGVVLADMQVHLTGEQEVRSTITGRDGTFRFLHLEPGIYQIEAYGRGYPKQVNDAVHILMGSTTAIHIQLRFAVKERVHPAPSETAPPVPPGDDPPVAP